MMEKEMNPHAQGGSVVLIAMYVVLCIALATCNALYLLDVIDVPPVIGSNVIILALGFWIWRRTRQR